LGGEKKRTELVELLEKRRDDLAGSLGDMRLYARWPGQGELGICSHWRREGAENKVCGKRTNTDIPSTINMYKYNTVYLVNNVQAATVIPSGGTSQHSSHRGVLMDCPTLRTSASTCLSSSVLEPELSITWSAYSILDEMGI
jgi:hypothetical protein